MILLDTNIVSEPFRAGPSVAVRQWLDEQTPEDLFLCAPVLAELHYGVERLAPSARRTRLVEWLSNIETNEFAGRILPFSHDAAPEFARMVAMRNRMGQPIGVMDALIAAIASVHGAAVATRDTHDFAELGIDVINPFRATT